MVQTVQDHAMVLQAFPSEVATELKQTWSDNWEPLDYEDRADCVGRSAARERESRAATERIKTSIHALRDDVLEELRSLD
jgi:hypothetical protein